MKPFLQHHEPMVALIACHDVCAAIDFSFATWLGRQFRLDYLQRITCQSIFFPWLGGTQVLVEKSDIGIVG